MRKQFETTLAGDEGPVDGIVNQINDEGSAWDFKSIDGTVHVDIARDIDGNWMRVGGTKPYLSSWTEELAKKVTHHI
jgi:hypothetical protein